MKAAINTLDLKKNSIQLFQGLDEHALKTHILKRLFEMKGWEVTDVHGDIEEDHKCDLILRSKSHGDEGIFIGVQVKAYTNGTHDIRNAKDAEKIRVSADVALRYPILNERGEPCRLAKFIWITAGHFKERGKKAIRERISKFEMLDGRVEVWDCNVLYRSFKEAEVQYHSRPDWPRSEIFDQLQINILLEQILSYREMGRGMFAAAAAYRVLRQAILMQPPDLQLILASLETALAALREDQGKYGYYHHVFRTALEAWRKLLRRNKLLFGHIVDNLAAYMAGEKFRDACEVTFGKEAELLQPFIRDFEAIFWQLDQLERYYVHGPAGLSTLLICRLLLRLGFPPTSPTIASRLTRLREELSREDNQSIDGACSLCTGTALSCLALTRDYANLQGPIDWLSSLRSYRFCYQYKDYSIDREPWEQAIHYAAAVLYGLIDVEAVRENFDISLLIEEVTAVFFIEDESKGVALVDRWMNFRNVDRFEVYRYIFSGLLAFRLRHGDFSAWRAETIKQAIETMMAEIKEDCGTLAKRWFVYSTRLNLDTFTLGVLLEIPEAIEMARQVARIFRYRAGRASSDPSGPLWDSNVDRTTIFVESYLNYWETLFYLREQGRPVSDLLPAVHPPQE